MKNSSKPFSKILGSFRIKSSFAARMSFYVILLTAVLFIGASITISIYSRSIIRNDAIKNATNQLKSTNLEIENVLLGVSVAIDNLADEVRDEALKGNKKQLFELTKKVVAQNEHVKGCDIGLEPYFFRDIKYFSPYALQKEDGSITVTQVGSDDYAYQFMDWYQIPKLLGRPYWTDPFFDAGAGNAVMCTYTCPLYDYDNQFIGVLTADLAIDWLTNMVMSIKPYKNSYNVMIGKSGAYIVHPDSKRISNETIFTTAAMSSDTSILQLGKEMIQGHSGMHTLKVEDTYSFAFYAPIPSAGWSIAMVCPSKDVYEDVIRMNTIMIIVAIVGLLLLFFLVRAIIGKISKPLSIFSKSALSIAEGNFDSPLPDINTHDEMQKLRDSFQYMQKSLTTYITVLKETTSVKERIESELNIARNIQMGMIPKIFPPFPERSDIDLFAMLRPAKEVGGDLYDFFINDENLYFAIGDVSGKGVPASLFMAVTRSLFRSVATTLGEPKVIVESMNGAISETNEANMFVTMFVGILDLKTGDMKFCNAGHNPPCLITKDGNVSFMEIHQNLPIGLFDTFQYDTQTIHIEEGTTIFLYTDGLTEAENPEKELYTDPRLLEALKEEHNTDAETLIRRVYDSVEEHVNGALQSDDLTMLVVKYIGNSVPDDYASGKKLIIKNQVDELKKLEAFIEQAGEATDLSPALIMSLNLAMEEAVSNVIFYAYPKGEIDHTIEIIFSKKGKEITFEIRDSGVPFDPTAKEDADITLSAEERNIGGLGIYMVKQIMDKVEYKREMDKNILTMVKILE